MHAVVEHFSVEDDAITREGYYRANGLEVPSTNGNAVQHRAPERACAGCGASLEGRDDRTVWCGDSCRKKYKRANGTGVRHAGGTLLAPVNGTGKLLTGSDDDGLVELVGALAQTRGAQLVAVSFEYSDGWCCTVGRTTEQLGGQ